MVLQVHCISEQKYKTFYSFYYICMAAVGASYGMHPMLHTKHVKTVNRQLTHGYEWVYQTAAMTKM